MSDLPNLIITFLADPTNFILSYIQDTVGGMKYRS